MERALGGKSITLRIEMKKAITHFGDVATCISNHDGDIIAIDVIQTTQNRTIRDLSGLKKALKERFSPANNMIRVRAAVE